MAQRTHLKEHGSEDTSDVTPENRAGSSGNKLINPQMPHAGGTKEGKAHTVPSALGLPPVAKE